MKTRTLLVTLALSFLVTFPAAASGTAKLYLNGEELPVGSARDLELREVTEVWFDPDGNIHIIAPAYNFRIERPGGDAARSDVAVGRFLGRRVWLIVLNQNPGTIPYHVRVTVNGSEVHLARPDQSQHVMEITRFLRLGDNRIELDARRGGAQAPGAPDALYQVILATATEAGDELNLGDVHFDWTMTPAEDRARITEERVFRLSRP